MSTTDISEARRLAQELTVWARDYATTDYTDEMASKSAVSLLFLADRLEAATRALEHVRQQAGIWKQEARTQKSTVDEVGAALGGVPDWGPVVETVQLMVASLETYRAARAPKAGEWQPASDGLPPIGKPVWIAAWAWDNPGGTRIYGVAVYDGKAWGNPQDPEQSATWWPPTHWMELKEPAAATGRVQP